MQISEANRRNHGMIHLMQDKLAGNAQANTNSHICRNILDNSAHPCFDSFKTILNALTKTTVTVLILDIME